MYCRPSILGQYIGTYIKCLLIEWLWWSKQQSIWSFLPFFSKLKAKLKREQFEKERRRLACRARRAPKQKRLEREEKKLKGNMSLPVNLSSDFQRSLVSFTTCWHCFPPPPLCPLEVERLGKNPAWILKSFWSHHSKVTKTIVGLQTDTIFCQRKLPLLITVLWIDSQNANFCFTITIFYTELVLDQTQI